MILTPYLSPLDNALRTNVRTATNDRLKKLRCQKLDVFRTIVPSRNVQCIMSDCRNQPLLHKYTPVFPSLVFPPHFVYVRCRTRLQVYSSTMMSAMLGLKHFPPTLICNASSLTRAATSSFVGKTNAYKGKDVFFLFLELFEQFHVRLDCCRRSSSKFEANFIHLFVY